MTRLIHLANYPNLHAGSFIPMLGAVMDAGIARGWRAEAVFTDIVDGNDWEAGLGERGIRVRKLEPGSRRGLARRVGEIVAESDQPAILHTHFTKYDLAAASCLRGREDCPLFWHIHTVLAAGPLSIARNAAKFALFGRRVDGIVVPAANIGEGLVRRRAPAEKILLLPSPIDAGEFKPASPAEREAARRELGVGGDAAVLLHIGRAWELKGGDLFLAAVKLLTDAGRDVVGVSLRGGEEGEREAERLGITERVRIPGRVDEIRDLYAAADCFVAPSRGEGMPFSLVEALASGVPVVATDHLPGHRFLAEGAEACRVVPGRPERLAEAIESILARDPDLAAEQAAAGREFVEQRLSLSRAAETLIGHYEQALERRAA